MFRLKGLTMNFSDQQTQKAFTEERKHTYTSKHVTKSLQIDEIIKK